MAPEGISVQQLGKLFVHYRDALRLDAGGDKGMQMQGLNELPAAERDRMIAASRLELLEIEANANLAGEFRGYGADVGQTEWVAENR